MTFPWVRELKLTKRFILNKYWQYPIQDRGICCCCIWLTTVCFLVGEIGIQFGFNGRKNGAGLVVYSPLTVSDVLLWVQKVG